MASFPRYGEKSRKYSNIWKNQKIAENSVFVTQQNKTKQKQKSRKIIVFRIFKSKSHH